MNNTEVNKTDLQTVLDDIKLFSEHYERSNKDAAYYESIIDVLTNEKHKIERHILKVAEESIAELPEDTKETVVREVIISEEEVLRLVVAISVQKQKDGGRSQVVKLVERGESISVIFHDCGVAVDLTDAKNW